MRIVLEWRHYGQPETHAAVFFRSGPLMIGECVDRCIAHATERANDTFLGWEWHRVTVDDSTEGAEDKHG